ncbi:MAG: HlyD family secretion protein [Candidatus Acidiferrales bacterium]
MDIIREDLKRSRKKKRIFMIAGALIFIVAVSLGLSRLRPAAPTVDGGVLWPGTVKRGNMLREDRGLGTLVPVTVQVVPATTDGRVIQRLLLPGEHVHSDSVILELSNPTLQQQALNAEYQLRSAEASLKNLKAQLDNQLMDQRAKAAGVRSQYHQAKLDADTNTQLAKLGLTSDVVLKKSIVQSEELEKQNEIAEKQVETFENSIPAQLAVQQATVDQDKALYALEEHQLEQLHVRAGIEGVLQEVTVEVGAQVTPGTILARVGDPLHLKAALQIAETQAKDVLKDQKAMIDTHNGIIPGHVWRIDPSVLNGTRTVDVWLDGPLPPGAVPSLSVEGTIEIENLQNVLYVERPVHGEPDSTISLFKYINDGSEAVRVPVHIGKTSVSTVEVLSGLNVNDKVILSDMSAYDNVDRVRVK